jgi:hypothetical protein
MTKKVAKKANVMSLKDFYGSAPGKTHLETLPNKSGDVPRYGEAPRKTIMPGGLHPVSKMCVNQGMTWPDWYNACLAPVSKTRSERFLLLGQATKCSASAVKAWAGLGWAGRISKAWVINRGLMQKAC